MSASLERKHSKKALFVCLSIILCLGVSVAIALATVFARNDKLSVTPDMFDDVDMTSEPLVNSDGWNASVMAKLGKTLERFADNMALSNPENVNVSKVVSLGGIKWTVVYKQNNVITLLANQSVATLPYNEVESYLNNEFYSSFCDNVGYADIEEYIVPFGTSATFFQISGAQAVDIETLNGADILDFDATGSKFWLPSAYEVGGFKNTLYSPKARANSFKSVNVQDDSTNAGLYNLSNAARNLAGVSWLRNSTKNSNLVIQNGVVTEFSGLANVRPCVNLQLPEQKIVSSDGAYSAVSSSNLAFTGPWSTDSSGNYLINSEADLLALSAAVLSGNNFSGKTFLLTKNLDFSNCTIWMPIGFKHPTKADYDKPFSGTFNGQGYKVSHLSDANSGLAGLFGYTYGGAIQNVAVVDSSWYTRRDYVGGLVCYCRDTNIDKCYNECGVSGLTYVGGIVGAYREGGTSSTNYFYVQNCYNAGAIAGNNYVGGIIGGRRTSANTTYPKIKYCYNRGSVVANGTSIDAISVHGAFTNVYAYEYMAHCRTSACQKTFVQMRTQGTFANYDFTNTWYMPDSDNERMPMLRVFVKNANVKTFAYINGVGLTNQLVDTTITTGVYSGTTLKTGALALNTNYTMQAKLTFATGKHYQLEGWYFAELDEKGIPVNFVATGWTTTPTVSGSTTTFKTGNIKFNSTGTTGTSLVVAEDVVLVAKFNRLFCFQGYETARGYVFSGSGYTTALNVTYKNGSADAKEYAASGKPWASGDGNKWFIEGTVMNVEVTMPTGAAWWRVLYSTTYSSSFINDSNAFDNSKTFSTTVSTSGQKKSITITLGDTENFKNASNVFLPSGDELYIYMDFVRTLKITLAAAFGTSGTTAVNATNYGNVSVVLERTNQLTFNSSYTLTATNSTPASGTGCWGNEKIRPKALVAGTNYDSTKLAFNSWKLYYDNADKKTLTAGTDYEIGTGLAVAPYTITEVYIYARFTAQTQKVKLTENTENGVARLSSGYPGTPKTFEPQENKSITASVGTTYYIYIMPDWSNFYTFDKIVAGTGAPAVTMSLLPNTEKGVYYGTFKLTSKPSSEINYTVYYKVRNDLEVQYSLEAPSAVTSDISLPGALTAKDPTYTYNNTDVYLTFANNAHQRYYVSVLQKKPYSGTNAGTWQNLTSPKSEPSSPAAKVYVKDLVGTTYKIGDLLKAGGDSASYLNRVLYLRFVVVLFNAKTITTKVTVDGLTNQTLSGFTTYSKTFEGGSATAITDGKAEPGAVVTITLKPGAGYSVSGASGVTFSTKPTTSTTAFGTQRSGTFTMPTTNVTITITVVSKIYKFYYADNISTPPGTGTDWIATYNASQTVTANSALEIKRLNTAEAPNTYYQTVIRSNPDAVSTWAANNKVGYEAKETITGAAKTYSYGESNQYTLELVKIRLVGHRTASSSKQYYDALKTWTSFSSSTVAQFTVSTADALKTLPSGVTYTAYTDLVLIFEYQLTEKVTVTVTANENELKDRMVLIILGKLDSSGNITGILPPILVRAGNNSSFGVPGDGDYQVLVSMGMNVGIKIDGSSAAGGKKKITISGNAAKELAIVTNGYLGGSTEMVAFVVI